MWNFAWNTALEYFSHKHTFKAESKNISDYKDYRNIVSLGSKIYKSPDKGQNNFSAILYKTSEISLVFKKIKL